MAGWFKDLAIAVAPALIGAGVSAYVSNKQTSKAQKAISKSTDKAITQQERIYQDARRDSERKYEDSAQQRAMQEVAFEKMKRMQEPGYDISKYPGLSEAIAASTISRPLRNSQPRLTTTTPKRFGCIKSELNTLLTKSPEWQLS